MKHPLPDNILRQTARLMLFPLLLLTGACSSIPKDELPLPEKQARAVDYSTSGKAYFAEGSYREALSLFSNALAQQVLADNREGIAGSYYNIGRCHLEMGSFSEAEEAFTEGLRLAREDSLTAEVARGTILMGELALKKGDFQGGETLFMEALTLLGTPGKGEDGLIKQQAVALHDLGVARKQLGKLEEAESALLASLEINLNLRAMEEQANNHYMLASLHFSRKQYQPALDQIEKALKVDRLLERSLSIAEDLFAKGSILKALGEMEGAYTSFGQSFMIYQTLEMPRSAARALGRLAELAGVMGMAEKEQEYLRAKETLEGTAKEE